MADHEKLSNSKKDAPDYMIKKCPECFEYLPLHAKVCTGCQTKLGEVNQQGFARKQFDWLGYLVAGAGVIGFAIYLWWAFFRE